MHLETKYIPKAKSVQATKPRVPHISLVFREMWDTTPFGRKPSKAKQTPKEIGRVPHVRLSVHGPRKPGVALSIAFIYSTHTTNS
jgi:hypothetical protein